MAATSSSTLDDTDVEPALVGPVIGRRRTDRVRSEPTPFSICSYSSAAADAEETLHEFLARFDEIDAATVAEMTRRGVTGGQIMGVLLVGMRKVLCDDDGIPAAAPIRPCVERGGQWVDMGDLPDGDQPRISEFCYRLGDSEPFERLDDAIAYGVEHGSSHRRFEHLMDPDKPGRVEQSALEGLLELILGGGGTRPTSSSRAARRSRQTKKTRSGRG